MAALQPQHSLQEKQQVIPPVLLPAPVGCNPLYQRASLYVGDLDPNVTEIDLWHKFSSTVPVASVRICRCAVTGRSLRYGYVNFNSYSHACKALAFLNHTELKGKPIRIMWSQRDPSQRKSGVANLFVKNLDPSINSANLQDIFCPYGNIISCKVPQEKGKGKGYGFVQFDSEDSALTAQTALHDTIVEGKKIYVSKFVKKSDRTVFCGEPPFTNLYVKNVGDDVTDDLLAKTFSAHGAVQNAMIMKDSHGRSRGFGFVSFKSPDEAKKAVEAMNGIELGSKILFVGRAQKKSERTEILKQKYKEMVGSRLKKLETSKLYVSNLSESVDEERLRELFGCYGMVKSAKIMRCESGRSKKFAFVCFSSPEEAKEALDKLNGAFFEGKILHVGMAQRKEDRIKKYQNTYASQPMQYSSYPLSPDEITNQLHPFYFSYSPYSPVFHIPRQPFPLLHNQIVHQSSGANAGVRYMPIYQTSGSYVLGEQNLSNTGNAWNRVYRQYNFAKENIRNTPNETSLAREAAIGNLGPFTRNLQTGYVAKGSGTLLDVNSPNSKTAKGEQTVEGQKKAKAAISLEPGVTFPKSGLCLRY
ncbi:polyadenylate-binding protein 6 [Carica papaya]|uniref:polyadenylate-binding protein 6 n=1 Tax=Carica papaya TaxID=3649 RepID=UPI000B8C8E7C|nr:polyadenylate-binding protein 6 [Carica papaya]